VINPRVGKVLSRCGPWGRLGRLPLAERLSYRLLLLALVGCLAVGCGKAVADHQMTPAELATRLQTDTAPLVLDVRSQAEYSQGHIPGAIHIQHHELTERLDELPIRPTEDIIVYCEAGVRAARAEKILEAAGFESVRPLDGHMRAWRQQQRPIARPNSSP
jgi:phage shock protein E